MGLKKQVIDQSAHFAAALTVAVLVGLVGVDIDAVQGLIIGVSLGLVREITEKDPIDSGRDVLDLIFWTFGGIAGGWIL